MELKFKAQKSHNNETVCFDLKYFLENDDNKMPDGMQYVLKNIRQFTGLKDKNGVEIYQGDIVKGFKDGKEIEGITDVVVFESAMFQLKNTPSKLINFTYELSNKQCEVIGNIYENPELLSTI